MMILGIFKGESTPDRLTRSIVEFTCDLSELKALTSIVDTVNKTHQRITYCFVSDENFSENITNLPIRVLLKTDDLLEDPDPLKFRLQLKNGIMVIGVSFERRGTSKFTVTHCMSLSTMRHTTADDMRIHVMIFSSDSQFTWDDMMGVFNLKRRSNSFDF
jgi:hypothetical protein